MKRIWRLLLLVADDVCYLGGLALLSCGAYDIYPPAGLISAGAGFIAYAVLIARK